MLLSDKSYATLKWIAQYFLPASGTLYFALAKIWGLPYGEEIVGTISAIDIFLGVLLGLSTAAYKKSDASSDGTLMIDTTSAAKDIYRLSMNGELTDLAGKTTVTFKVDPNAKL